MKLYSSLLIRRLIVLLGTALAVCRLAVAGIPVTAGAYRVELTTDPGVIAVGRAKLLIKLTDASGKPVTGATIRSLARMPAMVMGEREETSVPVPDQPGMYTIPATFAMEGDYETSLAINGPSGPASVRIPLATGLDTTRTASQHGMPSWVGWSAPLVVVLLFTLYRMGRTGQRLDFRQAITPAFIGSLLLLAVLIAGAVFAVGQFRRKGALTPIEAQAMDMSNLPAPSGYASVTLATARRAPLARTVRYTGTVAGYGEQDITPRVSGVLTWMPLYAGDTVRRGQRLARLDTSQTQPQLEERQAAAVMAARGVDVARAEATEAEAAIAEAQAELFGKQGMLREAEAGVQQAREAKGAAIAAAESARSQIADAEAQVSGAKADAVYGEAQIQRSETLYKRGALSGEELQRDKAQAENATAKLRQAEAQLARTKAEHTASTAAVRQADTEIRRASAMVQRAQAEVNASQTRIRAAQAAATTARRKITLAQSGTAQAGASLNAAIATRAYSEIRAESDGVVLQRLISPGALIAPGQTILKIAQIQPVRLQVNVTERDLARIPVGATVRVLNTDRDSKPVTVRVTTVAPTVDPVARTGMVEALFSNTDRRFVPGQSVTLEIEIGTAADALQIPLPAIHYDTSVGDGVITDKAQPFVWVAEANGSGELYSVRRQDVILGIQNQTMIAVVDGLNEGASVVVAGANYLKPGDTVAAIATEDGADIVSSGTVGGTPTYAITVTEKGFEPATLRVPPGKPIRLALTRKTNSTCATEIIIPSLKINKPLPLHQTVTVELTPPRGEIAFACAMDMIKGKVVAQ